MLKGARALGSAPQSSKGGLGVSIRAVLTDRKRLRTFVTEQKCVPWRVRRFVKRYFLRPYRWLAFGRININTAEHWDQTWQREGFDTWRTYPKRFARVVEMVPQGCSVLDVGCGVGVLAEKLRKDRACRVIGMDISPVAIRLLNQRSIPGLVGALPSLPIRPGLFDAVIATELIEHLDDPSQGVAELTRCLRTGGLLILTTPNDTLGPEDQDEHMQQFTPQGLRRLVSSELDDVQVEVLQESWRTDGRGSEECILLRGFKRQPMGRLAGAVACSERAAPQGTVMPQALPRVSVIIPTKNRPSDLELVVKSIFKQSVTPQELIIVDQSESDDAKEQVEKEYAAASRAIRDCLKLCYFRDESIMGVNDARNRAMEIAAGDVWLFLDDDVELEPTFLEELLVVYLRFPHVGGVSGIITNYRPPSWAFRIWTWLFARGPFHDERQPIYWKADRLREADPIPVSKFGSGLMSFRAEVLRGLRFDSNLNRALGEDVDFCARLKLGTALVITPRARLIHKRSLTARSEQHWLQRYAQACQYLYRRYWRRGIKNRLCFAWVNLGCALVATLAILRRRSLDPWRALAAGIREGRKTALDVR